MPRPCLLYTSGVGDKGDHFAHLHSAGIHGFDKANRELMGTQLFTNRAMVAMMPFMTLITVSYTHLGGCAGRADAPPSRQ